MDLDELMEYINNPVAGESKEGKKKKKNKAKNASDNTTEKGNSAQNNDANIKLEELANQKNVVKTFDENKENTADANLINIDKIILNENTPIVNTNLESFPKPEGELTEGAEKQGAEGEEKKKKKKKKKKTKKDPNSKNEKEEESDKEEEDNKPRENPYRKLWDFTGKDITKLRFQDNSTFRVLRNWKEGDSRQTNWPTLDIDQQYPNQDYPVGEILEYGQKNIWRSTSAEKKEMERLLNFEIQSLRKAAEVHRQVRKFAQQIIRPGMRLIDICNQIENMNRFLVNKNELKCGIAFPTGCSLNHVAAHYTPNPGDFRTLEYNDVCKIDYGTHVNGYIIDCAFTVAFNPQFDDLLLAVQDATDTGIKEAGIDVRLCDVGAAIQEVMESYEVVINGKTYPVKSVKNLCGHSIEPYKIHAGKSVPIVKNNDYTKMEEGELYAIETFGSTGKGWIYEDTDCSHYMKEYRAPVTAKFRSDRARQLFNHITKSYSTLAFCRKWLEEDGFTNHSLALRQLVDSGHINPYPPLSDNPGCYVAQFEHTIFMKPTCKEVISRGDDY